jgi:hypothetical protein
MINKKYLILSILTFSYFLYYALSPHSWHFIDSINLVIHEAGHVIFIFFGKFLHILGGSLFQVLFPSLFVFYFYRQQSYFSSSLLLFWVGQSIINVSVYASDAQNMNLPLIGGDTSGHDWNNILNMTGLLTYTEIIGKSIYIFGFLIIIIAFTWSLSISLIQKRVKEEGSLNI